MNHSAVRLGMAMWSHSRWQDTVYRQTKHSTERLARYSQMFNTVEGNTTFYATPSAETVQDWRYAVPDTFRFTFKFPQTITHQQSLSHCRDDVLAFLRRMSPLLEVTGLWKIQLPKQFSPIALPTLEAFIRSLPTELNVGVEVRHPDFFAKGEEEKRFNRTLMELGTNRIIMDSRPLFAATPDSPSIIDAQSKKPRVPVHALATGHQPMIRFIGHPVLTENDAFFHQWMAKLIQWMSDGLEPYLFVHTPDNNEAPQLAYRLYEQLSNAWQAKKGAALPPLTPLGTPETSNQIGFGF